jgi:branched-chain amino acid aminotransferase
MTNVFYVDGNFVAGDDALIPITDLAVVRGYGVFDFMRTYGGVPFHLEQHVARLFRSAERIALDMPWTPDEVIGIVHETLARNDHAESSVRIVVTGGDSTDLITPLGRPRLIVLCLPAAPPPAEQYERGIKVITVDEHRYLPDAKTLNYIPAIRALKKAKASGAVEAIYTDSGRALEGTTTNLFAFYGDTLVTPGAGILPGITRGVVIDLAREHYTLVVRDLPVEQLYAADEVFITASNKQVMPVVQVDDHRIAEGTPGPRTRQIMNAFAQYTAALAISRE